MTDMHDATLAAPAPPRAAPASEEGTSPAPGARFSAVAAGLGASAILAIAAEVQAVAARGGPFCNLTVGDFSPKEFPIPAMLRDGVIDALRAGATNYPLGAGVPELRQSIRDWYERRLGLHYTPASVLVGTGARPLIYTAYRVLVDPGDRVVYPVPSWNNNYYTMLVGGQPVEVPCDVATNFHPTAVLLREPLRGARLLVLSSPLNPTGTLIGDTALAGICDVVLEENARRERTGERPLYVLYDQVYWTLTLDGGGHVNPVALRPELAPYVLHVDAISKAFAATGLRVGWVVGPDDIVKRMSDYVGHVGAWAPKPEQLATARLLADDTAIAAYHDDMRAGIRARLDALAAGLAALRDAGFPVDATAPQGTIYLSARFALHGRRTSDGQTLATNADIRRYLLHEAGLAVVEFQAFGAMPETGWMRLSVGAVSLPDLQALLPRIRGALERLT